MKVFDKYILLKFFKTFLFVVVVLNVIICIVDYAEKSDDFIRAEIPFKEIVFDYYLNFIVFMASSLSPIAIFISAVFITARMASHSEIIAMLSSGMSYIRFVGVFLGGSIAVAIITFVLVGWVIPDAAKTKVAFQVKYLKKPYYYDGKNIHLKTSDSTYAYMESYRNTSQTGYQFTLEKIDGTKLVEKLSSNKIQWDSTLQKWHIDRYKHLFFDNSGDLSKISEGKDIDTVLNITPQYFESRYRLNETMTLKELDDFIEIEKARGVGNVEVFLHEKYERYAYPFAVILLTLMGAIVASRKTRQGSGFQIALGFLFAFIFILFVMMSRSIGAAGSLSPMLAAWLPTIIFSFVTAGLYFYAPK